MPSRSPDLRIWLLAVAMTFSACGSAGGDVDDYFEGLANAYSADDIYSVLDHYAPGATIEHRTGEFGARILPTAQFLALSRGDLARTVLGVHTDAAGALVFIERSVADDLETVMTDVSADGAITHEKLLVSLASLERGAHISPEVADRYVDLTTDLAASRSTETQHWEPLDLADALGKGDGLAVFLDPLGYGDDPLGAVSVYEVSSDACTEPAAVYWTVGTDDIAHGQRVFHDPASSCSARAGWWTAVTAPDPRDELTTGSIAAGGRTVEIHNGTAILEDFVVWGFGRFAAAGLAPPDVDSVTFQPTRRCAGLAGRVIDVEAGRDLYACVYEFEVCARTTGCADIRPEVRFGLLHELAHAWLQGHTSEETRTALLQQSGRSRWNDLDDPWAERGAEYAAEVIAWGLMDEPLPLIRIGSPSCTEITDAFTSLTGTAPIPTCTPAP